jgi:hypothetical protein
LEMTNYLKVFGSKRPKGPKQWQPKSAKVT